MSKIELANLLQEDINELKGIIYKNYDLTNDQVIIQTKAILSNLEDNLAELFENLV